MEELAALRRSDELVKALAEADVSAHPEATGIL